MRDYVYIRHQLGEKGEIITSDLKNVYGDDVVSQATVFRWISDIRNDFFKDKRAENSGRNITVTNEEAVDDIRKIIMNNRGITIDELIEITDISHGSIQRIITNKLQLRSFSNIWVPHELTERQEQNRMTAAKIWLSTLQDLNVHERVLHVDEKWFYLRSVGRKRSNRSWVGGSSDMAKPEQSVQRNQFEQKFMAVIGVTFSGKYHFELLDRGESMNSDRYIVFLKAMIKKFSRHVKPITWQNMIFVQDNARPHKSRTTLSFLEGKDVLFLDQPAYSPDYNVLDRFVNDYLEVGRNKVRFESKEELNIYIKQKLSEIDKNQWEHQMEKLITHLKEVVKYKGRYC